MLNGRLKKEAINNFNVTVENHQRSFEDVQKFSTKLLVLRKQSSEEIIGEVENYINNLANSPKEFDRSYHEFKNDFQSFNKMLIDFEVESKNIDSNFGKSATAGVLAGVGTVAFVPTVAMAMATTFGTASTGVAIASLSGAAATNAALATLGGGAIAVGGGGMVAGKALLALTGPIGWGIGILALIGSGAHASNKNEQIAKEANSKRKDVEGHISKLKSFQHEINELTSLTELHVEGLKTILSNLIKNSPQDYSKFSGEDKNQLGALVNHIQSLSKLLNRKINS